MTRTATTKLVATALAVASLGMASTAQAKGDVADAPEPVPTPAPAQAPAPAMPAEEEAPATQAAQEEEEIDYSSPEYFKSDEAKERFKRYCNMTGAEPSHNDKKFCEDFRKHNGTTTSTGGGGGKTTTTGGGGKYEKPNYEKPSYEKTGYDKPVTEVKKAMGKELPYTGLEMWQLGLIGIVLSGGGLGARRLLAS